MLMYKNVKNFKIVTKLNKYEFDNVYTVELLGEFIVITILSGKERKEINFRREEVESFGIIKNIGSKVGDSNE